MAWLLLPSHLRTGWSLTCSIRILRPPSIVKYMTAIHEQTGWFWIHWVKMTVCSAIARDHIILNNIRHSQLSCHDGETQPKGTSCSGIGFRSTSTVSIGVTGHTNWNSMRKHMRTPVQVVESRHTLNDLIRFDQFAIPGLALAYGKYLIRIGSWSMNTLRLRRLLPSRFPEAGPTKVFDRRGITPSQANMRKCDKWWFWAKSNTAKTSENTALPTKHGHS